MAPTAVPSVAPSDKPTGAPTAASCSTAAIRLLWADEDLVYETAHALFGPKWMHVGALNATPWARPRRPYRGTL